MSDWTGLVTAGDSDTLLGNDGPGNGRTPDRCVCPDDTGQPRDTVG